MNIADPSPEIHVSSLNGSMPHDDQDNESRSNHYNGKPIVQFPLTDVGNGDRLAYYHSADLRFCYQSRKWHVWDGRRWGEDRTGAVDRLAVEVARLIFLEAGRAETSEQREKIAKWGVSTLSNRSIRAMVERAQSMLAIVTEQMDTNRFLLNCQNGTLDLHTGELYPHRQEDYITKLVPVDYDPEAVCPTWDAFLNHIMDGRQGLIRFLQRAVGYTLTGDTREQVLFMLHGGGANGKSTFINTISQLLSDYAQQTPTDTLMARKDTGAQNDLARLRGARFVSAVESEEGRRLSEVLIKQLTGGDLITARFLFHEFFEFRPQFKIFLATNHRPVIRGTDNAIWRRIRLIPFEVTIPESEWDLQLGEKLRAELPGIFNWAIQGCLDWQQQGLGVPEEVSGATAGYREEMDMMQAFFDDHCIVAEGHQCTAKQLYATYTRWCDDTGEYKMSQKALALRLQERGFVATRGTGGTRMWQGISVLSV